MRTSRRKAPRTDFSPLPQSEAWHAAQPVHRMKNGLTPAEYGPRVAAPLMARLDALPIERRAMAHIFGTKTSQEMSFNLKWLIAAYPYSWRDTEPAFRLLAQERSHGLEAIRVDPHSKLSDLI